MIELIDGVLRFNVLFFCFNVILFLIFICQWWKTYRNTGMNIDIWNYNLLLSFIIPFILMYPFSISTLNIISVGTDGLYSIEDGIDEAYIVTLIGFIFIFIGKYCYKKFGFTIIVNSLFYYPFINTLGKYYKIIIRNQKVCQRLAQGYLFILFIFVFFTMSQGFVSNPRAFFMANSQYRPFYNLIISLFNVTFGIMSTRVIQYNKKSDKLLLLPITLFGFFLGVRAPLIFQSLGFAVLYAVYNKKGYVPIYKILTFAAFMLFLIILLVLIRNSSSDVASNATNSASLFFYEIFYGNTFSDIRDFSWVLGNWDRSYLFGMSYISAFLSFIPSALLTFREKWGIGRITVNMLGFDPTIHPGLRPGIFGEMYLNFGILGVIAYGFIWSQVYQKANETIRKTISQNDVITGSSALVASSFVANLSNSAGFFNFYVFFITLYLLQLLCRIRIYK